MPRARRGSWPSAGHPPPCTCCKRRRSGQTLRLMLTPEDTMTLHGRLCPCFRPRLRSRQRSIARRTYPNEVIAPSYALSNHNLGTNRNSAQCQFWTTAHSCVLGSPRTRTRGRYRPSGISPHGQMNILRWTPEPPCTHSCASRHARSPGMYDHLTPLLIYLTCWNFRVADIARGRVYIREVVRDGTGPN